MSPAGGGRGWIFSNFINYSIYLIQNIFFFSQKFNLKQEFSTPCPRQRGTQSEFYPHKTSEIQKKCPEVYPGH
ncbi:MAG: hypothetical protein A3G23_13445 [Bacteroidetes bacterium RIFCSPLOWO2_12_FULL_37_12]|nr:MAG: hypothetical protein A3G23_13445 [Bacteroidetes bacterium RIFCSPLOWO2_12_FULL_37_12]